MRPFEGRTAMDSFPAGSSFDVRPAVRPGDGVRTLRAKRTPRTDPDVRTGSHNFATRIVATVTDLRLPTRRVHADMDEPRPMLESPQNRQGPSSPVRQRRSRAEASERATILEADRRENQP